MFIPQIKAALRDLLSALGFLVLVLILVAYALVTGDVTRALAFAFAPDFDRLALIGVLAATGQAFFAKGVGKG